MEDTTGLSFVQWLAALVLILRRQTRKHLTKVEDELAKARDLLKQFQSSAKTATIRRSSEAEAQRSPQPVAERNGKQTAASFADTVQIHQAQINAPPNEHEHLRASRTFEKPSPAISLEPVPAATDFDWDERGRHNVNGQFIDGMASLTEHSTRGYMGVASGAAFLRLAGAADDSNVEGENHDMRDTAVNTPPLLPAVFSSAQLEPFIDAYFQTYHISYPIVHEATFRAQFMEVIPRPKGLSWSVLLYTIATIGAFAASELPPEVDRSLFEAAKARMTIDMFETGNLALVQALTLISNYVQKTNKPNSGYNYLGLARRMALGIGLHKEFPAWHSNPLKLEIRRRV